MKRSIKYDMILFVILDGILGFSLVYIKENNFIHFLRSHLWIHVNNGHFVSVQWGFSVLTAGCTDLIWSINVNACLTFEQLGLQTTFGVACFIEKS